MKKLVSEWRIQMAVFLHAFVRVVLERCSNKERLEGVFEWYP